jgi:arginase
VGVSNGTGNGRRRVGLLGVPTSAGSHNAGQDKAPAALRAAGLVRRLAARGVDTEDFGDLPTTRHRPAEPSGGVRDLARVAAIAAGTADRVAEIRAAGLPPLVLGGDCTITLGVVAGLTRHDDVGLVYFDGDADLSIPTTSGSGVLDTMGMTHLLGDGTDELAGLGPRRPLVGPGQVELFGFDPAELDTGEWTRLTSRNLAATPAPAVRQDPVGRAAAALARLEPRAGSVLVHLDVDVLDTGAFPLANFPHFAGLRLAEAAVCLRSFCQSPKFAGLVVTEVNPDHDPEGDLIPALIDAVAAALAPG